MHSIASLKQDLEDRKKLNGINHISVAETLNIIGITHHNVSGDQDEAIRHHQAALKILASQKSKSQEIQIHVAMTIIDIGNCFWKKGQCEQAEEMLRKAQKHLNICFAHQSHPRKLMLQQSIQNKLAHIHNSCTHTTAKIDKKQNKSTLDTDSNLLARLSSDDLLSSKGTPLTKRQSFAALSGCSVFRSESRLQKRNSTKSIL